MRSINVEEIKNTITKYLEKVNIYVDKPKERKKYIGKAEFFVMESGFKEFRVSVSPLDEKFIIRDDLLEWVKDKITSILDSVVEDSNKKLLYKFNSSGNILTLWIREPISKKGDQIEYRKINYAIFKIALNKYKATFYTYFYPFSFYEKEIKISFDLHLYIFLRIITEVSVKLLSLKGIILEEKHNIEATLHSLSREMKKEKKHKKNNETIRKAFMKLACQVYFPEDIKESFSDFVGYNSIKEQVKSAIIARIKRETLLRKLQEKTRKNPEIAKVPYSILFEGPPGVGKTMMAKIIAKETGLIMIYVSADQLLSKWVGETEQNIRAIFNMIKRFSNKKFILFFDEIDTFGSARNEESKSWERSQLLTLMQWLEGIETSHNYVFIATTNRKTDIDKALLSRFKEIISFPLPTKEEIVEILKCYAKHLSEDELKQLATKLIGFSPRDIKNICEITEHRHINTIENENELVPPSVELYSKVIAEKRKTK